MSDHDYDHELDVDDAEEAKEQLRAAMSKAEEIAQKADSIACSIGNPKLRAAVAREIMALVESYARERVSEWMISQGIATGHGDTLGDLFAELGGEIKRLRAARIREGQ